MMSDVVVLITGANRGIGFELTRQYLINGCIVIATCRDKSRNVELISLNDEYSGKLFIESMDITCPEQIERLANKLSEQNVVIDLIVNNAGYLDRKNQGIKFINYADAEMSFKVNSLGPLFLIHCLLPLLNKSRLSKIVIVSSVMGSLSKEQAVSWYGYRMSKAAANMLVVNLSKELEGDDVAVVAVHPGWVQTDMGGISAKENVNDSAFGIMKVVSHLTISHSGTFYDFSGDVLAY
jgi:NAD(P)-dependent dehydrogenase (short-subunit alcohol dehydrogenase family)